MPDIFSLKLVEHRIDVVFFCELDEFRWVYCGVSYEHDKLGRIACKSTDVDENCWAGKNFWPIGTTLILLVVWLMSFFGVGAFSKSMVYETKTYCLLICCCCCSFGRNTSAYVDTKEEEFHFIYFVIFSAGSLRKRSVLNRVSTISRISVERRWWRV